MRETLCPHFRECGGCKTLDQPYLQQLAQKQKIIEELFSSFSLPISPIIASPKIYSYRNKMEFSFAQSKENKKFLGLRRAKSNQVVSLDHCDLCSPWMIDVVKVVYAWFVEHELTAYFPPKNLGSLRTLTLRDSDQDRLAMLTVSGTDPIPEQLLQELIERLKIHSLTSILLCKQFVQKKVPTFFEQRILQGKNFLEQKIEIQNRIFYFKVRPQAFFQPNKFTQALLYEKSLEMLDLQGEEILFDLYAGTCTLSILAAHRVKKVLAVEINPDAVQDAKENKEKNTITNLEIYEQDVATFFSEQQNGIVIIDPPRSGLVPKAVAVLHRLNPKKILYISCNPQTQKRDLTEIIKGPYRLERLLPIDQFPHTHHIENLALLVRV